MSDDKKQIEEMARVLCGMARDCNNCFFNRETCREHNGAEALYTAGYRKQKVGEWLPSGDGINPIRCSICQSPALFAAGEGIFGDIDITRYPSPFCPNCGARMKGEKK